jgi:hypothetical protein
MVVGMIVLGPLWPLGWRCGFRRGGRETGGSSPSAGGPGDPRVGGRPGRGRSGGRDGLVPVCRRLGTAAAPHERRDAGGEYDEQDLSDESRDGVEQADVRDQQPVGDPTRRRSRSPGSRASVGAPARPRRSLRRRRGEVDHAVRQPRLAQELQRQVRDGRRASGRLYNDDADETACRSACRSRAARSRSRPAVGGVVRTRTWEDRSV